MAKRNAKAPTSKAPKLNKSKAKAARNECCPILHINCELVTPKAARKFVAVSDRWLYENPGKKTTRRGNKTGVWEATTGPAVKKCKVKSGTRHVFYGDAETAGRKLAALKKQLADRRCLAVVESNSGVKVSVPR